MQVHFKNDKTNIVIFGLGAIGSNLGLQLLRGIPDVNLYCVDYDIVEDRNISTGTQPYMPQHIRRPKTQSFQTLCMMHNKRCNIFNKKILDIKDVNDIILNITKNNTENLLIIDAFDNFDSRKLLHNKFLKNVQVLHIGFNEKMCADICWDDKWVESNQMINTYDICETIGANFFINSVVSLAGIVINEFIQTNIKKNIYFTKNYKIFCF